MPFRRVGGSINRDTYTLLGGVGLLYKQGPQDTASKLEGFLEVSDQLGEQEPQQLPICLGNEFKVSLVLGLGRVRHLAVSASYFHLVHLGLEPLWLGESEPETEQKDTRAHMMWAVDSG